MMHNPFRYRNIKKMLKAYGANPRKWSLENQDSHQGHLIENKDPKLALLVQEERQLDAKLMAYPKQVTPPQTLNTDIYNFILSHQKQAKQSLEGMVYHARHWDWFSSWNFSKTSLATTFVLISLLLGVWSGSDILSLSKTPTTIQSTNVSQTTTSQGFSDVSWIYSSPIIEVATNDE